MDEEAMRSMREKFSPADDISGSHPCQTAPKPIAAPFRYPHDAGSKSRQRCAWEACQRCYAWRCSRLLNHGVSRSLVGSKDGLSPRLSSSPRPVQESPTSQWLEAPSAELHGASARCWVTRGV